MPLQRLGHGARVAKQNPQSLTGPKISPQSIVLWPEQIDLMARAPNALGISEDHRTGTQGRIERHVAERKDSQSTLGKHRQRSMHGEKVSLKISSGRKVTAFGYRDLVAVHP